MLRARLERLLNRYVGESTRACEYRDRLRGRSLSLAIVGSPWNLTLAIDGDQLSVRTGADAAADVAVVAGLLDVPALLEADSAEAVRRANAEVRGDLGVADDFAQMLRHARPDGEGELARFVGDIPAHALGALARGGARWVAETHRASEQNIADYLQAESRLLPSALEVARFARDVEQMRDDVARLEQRLARLARTRE